MWKCSTCILLPTTLISSCSLLFFMVGTFNMSSTLLVHFPHSSVGKESTCNAGDLGSIPALGGFPGEGKGYPLQYYGLENSMYCIVHGVAKSRTWLSDFHFHYSLKVFTALKNIVDYRDCTIQEIHRTSYSCITET